MSDNKTDDGGRAFPKAALDPWGKSAETHAGMTPRDYFAAHAPEVPPYFPRKNVFTIVDDGPGRKRETTLPEPQEVQAIRWRWHYADLMIAARRPNQPLKEEKC